MYLRAGVHIKNKYFFIMRVLKSQQIYYNIFVRRQRTENISCVVVLTEFDIYIFILCFFI